MKRNKTKGRSSKIRCICDHQQAIFYRHPSLMRFVITEMTCEKCGSLWEIKLVNALGCAKGTLHVFPKAISLTEKAVEAMKEKQKEIFENSKKINTGENTNGYESYRTVVGDPANS